MLIFDRIRNLLKKRTRMRRRRRRRKRRKRRRRRKRPRRTKTRRRRRRSRTIRSFKISKNKTIKNLDAPFGGNQSNQRFK